MNNRTQPALRLVVDNTTPDPERERREQMAAELIAFSERARRGELAAFYWITVAPNQDILCGKAGKWKDAADDALFGVQVLGEVLCETLGKQPGTRWVEDAS